MPERVLSEGAPHSPQGRRCLERRRARRGASSTGCAARPATPSN